MGIPESVWEEDFELVKEKGEVGNFPEEFKDFRIWKPKWKKAEKES